MLVCHANHAAHDTHPVLCQPPLRSNSANKPNHRASAAVRFADHWQISASNTSNDIGTCSIPTPCQSRVTE